MSRRILVRRRPGPGLVVGSFSDLYFNQFDTAGPAATALGSEWEVYNADPGNGGFGVRAPSQVEVIAEASATSGANVLRLTAEDIGGEHYHGGVKLLSPLTYGQAELRVRVSDDASQVTSGVVLFWPTDNAVLFPVALNPEGVWPAGGELDFSESFDDRNTRTPFRSFIHRLNPAAAPPYTASDDEVVANYQHYSTDGVPGSGGLDQSDWHKIVCSWTPYEVSIEIDNGAKRVLTADMADIPDWNMELCLQLDAWSDTPPATPVTMDIDYVVWREYVTSVSLLAARPKAWLTTTSEFSVASTTLAVEGSPAWVDGTGNQTVTNPSPSGTGSVLAVCFSQGTTNSPTLTVSGPPGVSLTPILSESSSLFRANAWLYTNDGAGKTFGASGGADNRCSCILIPVDQLVASSSVSIGVEASSTTVGFNAVTSQENDLLIALLTRRDSGDTAGAPASPTFTPIDNSSGEATAWRAAVFEALAAAGSTTTVGNVTWSGSGPKRQYAIRLRP